MCRANRGAGWLENVSLLTALTPCSTEGLAYTLAPRPLSKLTINGMTAITSSRCIVDARRKLLGNGMWSLLGLALALFVAAAAWRRSSVRGGYFDAELYAMTAQTHRRYAVGSLAFALYFALAYALRSEAAGIVGLALYALIAAFYATSFLRGASDYDE
jgi:hypothetical protein